MAPPDCGTTGGKITGAAGCPPVMLTLPATLADGKTPAADLSEVELDAVAACFGCGKFDKNTEEGVPMNDGTLLAATLTAEKLAVELTELDHLTDCRGCCEDGKNPRKLTAVPSDTLPVTLLGNLGMDFTGLVAMDPGGIWLSVEFGTSVAGLMVERSNMECAPSEMENNQKC